MNEMEVDHEAADEGGGVALIGITLCKQDRLNAWGSLRAAFT